MNLMELFVKLGVDKSEFDRGLSEAEGQAQSASSNIGSALAHGVGMLAGAATAAVGAAATGITALTTQAVNAYGEYEQLVGGVEKLYGEAGDTLVANAAQAYETAGLSANQYMQTVTSFSAALLNSLDGDAEEAARIADIAMRDLSDNANTFGTMTTEELSSVYSALAKGNFTLLDNLNLGFAGSQQGMLDLVNASGIFEEEIDDINNVSFDQMLLAIHAVQENMNIAGTTANEAASTIQGSLGMLSGAWQNLITGLGDSSQDLAPLIDNVVDSALTVVENIRPIATQAIEGISTLIQQAAPMIAEELPNLIESVLPNLLNAIILLINTVSDVLPDLIEQLLPPILSAVITITTSLIRALPTIIRLLSTQLPVVLSQLIPAILLILPDVISAGMELLLALGQGIADNAEMLMDTVSSVVILLVDQFLSPDNIEQFISVGLDICLTIASALLEHTPEILGAIVILISNIIVALGESLPDIGAQVIEFLVGLSDNVADLLDSAFGDGLLKVGVFFSDILSDIGNAAANILSAGADLVANILQGIQDFISSGSSFVADGLSGWASLFSDWGSSIWDAMTGIWSGIGDIVADGIEALLDMMDFEWSLPDISLPHFNITGGVMPYGLGGQGQFPSISIDWYKRAYDQPMVFDDPTIFGINNGTFLGAGDGNGGEMVYGHENLMRDIGEVVASAVGNQPIVVQAIFGNEKFDEYVIKSKQRTDLITGGRG